ncbi:hypothetical protein [Treponema sp.]|uniref:hypothetical protein n=1 Tax=Treponema sp. TaxID=166 RepID=UPI003F02CFFF
MKFFLFICPLFLFFSCDFFSYTEDEKFTLPYSGEWKVRTSRSSECAEFTVNGNSFTAEVNKNEATALVAYSCSEKKICGTIYPYSMELTFQDGFAAEILLSLSASSADSDSSKNEYLSKFNWSRFMEECRVFEENTWKLDKERIMTKISSGNFKKTDLKLLE